jgi:hypothetical protein
LTCPCGQAADAATVGPHRRAVTDNFGYILYMIPAECPVCHKKPELAGNTPYCPSCGWNRDSAISALKMSMNSFPIGVLMFMGMAAFVYWGMGFKRSPQLMLFFLFPVAFLPWQYISTKRKLHQLMSVAITARPAGAPAANFGMMPSNAPAVNFDVMASNAPAVHATFPVGTADQTLLHVPVPRQIRMAKRGRVTLWVAAFGLLVFVVPFAANLYNQWSLYHSFSNVRGLGWGIGLECVVVLAAFGIWKGQTRECDLLEHGDIVMGRVTRQWNDKGNSNVQYEFTDFMGQQHSGWCQDYTNKLFADMPVAVFYDRDNPKRQIAACATLHEVVIP